VKKRGVAMKIEIWSDFVCPFCYIGKRRLEQSLETFKHQDEVTLEFKSYQLDPNAETKPNQNMQEYLSKTKGMPIEQVRQMTKNIEMQAKEVGLTYHFDSMQHTNTFAAHRVAKYAERQGKGNEMTEKLMHAFFTDSQLISDYEVLQGLAAEVGLDQVEVASILKNEAYAKEVRDDQEQARQLGIQGVPFFVFNEKYALSGAQPTEVFVGALEQVWQEEQQNHQLKSLNPKASKTTYCTDEGCEMDN
jgi:predicted DsbA family dithiol-disulfide isomerase